MGITLEKETVYEIVDKILEKLTLDELKKNYVKQRVNVDEVINFIQNNISQLQYNNLIKDLKNIQYMEVKSLDDFAGYVSLVAKGKALEGVIERTTAIIHETSKILTTDEKTNFLIDLKFSENKDYISKIMESYLANDLKE
ncbi:hypothetical protein Q73A0000_01340 [Kaistella flava (ex Peng et al. 2021)]|uniref:Uncharacterized protein n=1 Tax=Kaistella flava (ex Peng et al. 2021) TaxID=2038776 RepID=A0A7M2Y4R2_9FLAO|nr:hypothetical protein [Kaistella flava (ex Peng et al. 2021)]QOW09086.1 hypothetical protein Q73A0000_01340 [Kaistella flava (ex Peng et al. 2021)]